MHRPTLRTALSAGAAAASLALAGPALACVPDPDTAPPASRSATTAPGWAAAPTALALRAPTSAAPASSMPSLTTDQLRSLVLQRIDARLAWLTAVRQKVAAADWLTAAQQQEIIARIDAARTALSDLRSEVAAATTQDQVREALAGFAAAHPHALSADWGWFGRHRATRHEAGRTSEARARQTSDRAGSDSREKAGTEDGHRDTTAGDHSWDGDRAGDGDRSWDGDHSRDGDRTGDADRSWSGERDGFRR